MKRVKELKATIANVGMSRPPTVGDIDRLIRTLRMLRASAIDYIGDTVNIEYGRDFLTESQTYDVVIVHSVFHTNKHFIQYAWDNPEMSKQVSRQHSVERWKERLVSTRAKLIVIFEALPFSLGGWHLNDLSGYRISKRDHHITVYKAVKQSIQPRRHHSGKRHHPQ